MTVRIRRAIQSDGWRNPLVETYRISIDGRLVDSRLTFDAAWETATRFANGETIELDGGLDPYVRRTGQEIQDVEDCNDDGYYDDLSA